jgi:hypothetical protein
MTKPNVFIIESLKFEDERCNRHEGEILSRILHLAGKKSEYYYIRTVKELREVLGIFSDSDYRYLHLSCHGSRSRFFTTLDSIPFKKFAAIVGPYLDERRLFVSTCWVVNDDLATELLPNYECHSIIGPKTDVTFGDAAITWASFYYLVFRERPRAIKKKDILPPLQSTADAFDITWRFFRKRKKAKKGYMKKIIKPSPLDESYE